MILDVQAHPSCLYSLEVEVLRLCLGSFDIHEATFIESAVFISLAVTWLEFI